MQALLTALAGGTAPDGGSNLIAYPDLWYRGVLLPVDDKIAASTIVKKDDVLPQLWESSIYDGKMIGVPSLESYIWWGLNYNSKAAEDAGLDPDAPPATWEEAMEWHKALTKFDDAGNLQQMGLDPFDAMAGETDFASQSYGGSNWWDEANRKMILNSDAIAQSMDVGGEFIKLVGPDKFAGMRQDQNLGGWGAALQGRATNHDHRRLLASRRNADPEPGDRPVQPRDLGAGAGQPRGRQDHGYRRALCGPV